MKVSIILSTLILSQVSITFGTHTVAILRNGLLAGNGAIINRECVVTAASCVVGAKPSELIIRAGAENYNNGDGVTVEVLEIIPHKKYNASSHEYDIAVVVLKGCLAISTSNIDIIPISEKRTSNELCTLTGWVLYNSSVPAHHGSLQLKSGAVYRRSKCERVAEVNNTRKRMFCATGMAKTEKCMEFVAGTPLVIGKKLVGIKCFGFECNQNRPDFFTSVLKFSKFIETVIKRLA